MSPEQTRSFASAKDRWVGVLVLGVPLLTGVAMWQMYNETGEIPVSMILISGAAMALLLWIYFGTFYVIEDQKLRIYHGPFRWNITISSIDDLVETRSPFSAPALSMDRLRINYDGKRHVMVSPERRHEFISLVKPDRNS